MLSKEELTSLRDVLSETEEPLNEGPSSEEWSENEELSSNEGSQEASTKTKSRESAAALFILDPPKKD